jgi:hypothetical protein
MITAFSCNWICNIADYTGNGQGLLQGCASWPIAQGAQYSDLTKRSLMWKTRCYMCVLIV